MKFEMDQIPGGLRISNKEVSLPAFNAVWDTTNNQLVAIGLASSELQSLKSILATLSTNSKRDVTLRGDWPIGSVYLNNAKKGFFKMGRKLEVVNAKGYSLSLEHPTCIDPKSDKFPYFYVLGRTGEDFNQKLISHLNTAIKWPFLPSYADYVLDNGEYTGLLHSLEMAGPGYEKGVCIQKNDPGWEALLSAGITSGKISIFGKDN